MSQQFGLPVRGFPARMGRLAWRPLMGAVAAWLCVGAPAVVAQPVTSDGTAAIYTCVDDKGHKLTSDRPILECNGREQRILNRDGSLRQIKPPQMTADERAEREAAERRATLARNAQNDAIRRDRNLVNRCPDSEPAVGTVRMAPGRDGCGQQGLPVHEISLASIGDPPMLISPRDRPQKASRGPGGGIRLHSPVNLPSACAYLEARSFPACESLTARP